QMAHGLCWNLSQESNTFIKTMRVKLQPEIPECAKLVERSYRRWIRTIIGRRVFWRFVSTSYAIMMLTLFLRIGIRNRKLPEIGKIFFHQTPFYAITCRKKKKAGFFWITRI